MTSFEIEGIGHKLLLKAIQAKNAGEKQITFPYTAPVFQSETDKAIRKAFLRNVFIEAGFEVSEFIQTPDPSDDETAEEILIPFTAAAKKEAIKAGYKFA